ncbi:hypothetical protein HOLleu_25581 [Holothuria leucospilota]|uniref:Uncharacterized protein n=1 Tax=Holothuria leucospilota TaxID=206669 RepID=A0A9Q1H1Y1_HOLLE|nr:hypothetical protein HOLleu_25581 [Holothuria leucospilota]
MAKWQFAEKMLLIIAVLFFTGVGVAPTTAIVTDASTTANFKTSFRTRYFKMLTIEQTRCSNKLADFHLH